MVVLAKPQHMRKTRKGKSPQTQAETPPLPEAEPQPVPGARPEPAQQEKGLGARHNLPRNWIFWSPLGFLLLNTSRRIDRTSSPGGPPAASSLPHGNQLLSRKPTSAETGNSAEPNETGATAEDRHEWEEWWAASLSSATRPPPGVSHLLAISAMI